jgi:hypothetical protein
VSLTQDQRAEMGAIMREVLAEAIPVIVDQVVERLRPSEPKHED